MSSANSKSKIIALEQIAQALNDSGVKWAICHGLEDYPANIGRDLDIVIERHRLEDAVLTACQCLQNNGWTVLPNLQGWVWWIVAFRAEEDGEIASLQIDLFDHLQWAFTWVVDGPGTDTPLIRRGPFLDDRSACLGKTLILNGLSGGYRAFNDKPHYLSLTEEDALTLAPLIRRISCLEPARVTDLLLQGSPENVESAFNLLRASVRKKAILAPGKWPRLKSACLKQWVVNMFPKKGAPVIVISGEQPEAWIDLVEHTFASLVFHKTIVYRDATCSWMEAHLQKRRSCLQCVSIYAETQPPKRLTADIIIHTQSDGSASLTISGESTPMQLYSHHDDAGLKIAIMEFLKARSSHLQALHYSVFKG